MMSVIYFKISPPQKKMKHTHSKMLLNPGYENVGVYYTIVLLLLGVRNLYNTNWK